MSPQHAETTPQATTVPAPAAIPAPARDGDRGKTRQQRSELTRELLDRASATTDEATRDALLEEVVLVNRGVAEAVAARYRNRGIAQDDLVQVAYEGLTKAVRRFDPALRNDLLTYAVPTIRGEVQRYFRDQGWTVRPPRRIQELQWRVNRCLDDLGHELGREPRDEEVMSRLALGSTEYREVLEAFGCFQPTSLDNPVSADGATTLGELIADEDRAQRASEARVVLAPVVRQLSERDRRILYLRFFEDRTQEQIGTELGVTQMQVSRLLSRILRRLRDQVEGEVAPT
ncbi:sigma-70 family RNA polymerase sigma factor [Nocardioides sp. zg-DK7169]|uniref:sigma-70 family RNA polymerase sigma factor n=1 Tax=Nocardioides sp. zg-DK7169 TaxID=2736600 RepID=UPI001551ADCD|nr:sigma-70 family RNA polymerase sigma factor [Nocardioides sp. zg-DK7169]NPC98343.1 sigma-70 family RNA polymerase sigma factor [Nocardioides sp. zg-DK7169]